MFEKTKRFYDEQFAKGIEGFAYSRYKATKILVEITLILK